MPGEAPGFWNTNNKMTGNRKRMARKTTSVSGVDGDSESSTSPSSLPGCRPKRRRRETTEKFPETLEKSVTSADDLNDDCLERIFKYLPLTSRLAARMVCKRWEQASKQAWSNVKALNFSKCGIWNDLDELPPQFRSNLPIGAILRCCGGYLRELRIGEPCTYKILTLVGEYCINLSRLEVSFQRYGQRFTTLFSKMEKLEYFGMKNITSNIVGDFWGNSIQSLREIHLFATDYGGNEPTKPTIKPSALQFPNLCSITLEGFLLDPVMISLISSTLGLTHLSLARSQAHDFSPLTQLSNLQHLNLSQTMNVNDDFLIKLTNNSRNLRYLNLSECGMITPRGLRNLANLPHLEELLLNCCTVTEDIIENLRNLKKLECTYCWSIRDSGIINLMNHSPELKYLNLTRTSVSKKVLEAALKVARRRDNLSLWVIVDTIVKRKWERDEGHAQSHLLIIDDARKVQHRFTNDEESLMEIYEENTLISDLDSSKRHRFDSDYDEDDSDYDD